MLYSGLVFAAAAFFQLASAQNFTAEGPYTVDPNTVSAADRNSLCQQNLGTCRTLCGQRIANNTCDQASITFNCTCTPPTTIANVSDIAGMLPSLVCGIWKNQCLAQFPDDIEGQAGCNSVICGSSSANEAQSAQTSSVSTRTSTTSASESATDSPDSTRTSDESAAASQTGAAVALAMGKQYGSGALVVALLGMFGMAL